MKGKKKERQAGNLVKVIPFLFFPSLTPLLTLKSHEYRRSSCPDLHRHGGIGERTFHANNNNNSKGNNTNCDDSRSTSTPSSPDFRASQPISTAFTRSPQ